MQENNSNDKADWAEFEDLAYKAFGRVHWGALIVFMVGAVLALNMNLQDISASVLPTQKADPFDGTAMPILFAPVWTSLNSSEYDLDFGQIPPTKIGAIQPYSPESLLTSYDDLVWSNPNHLNIRNAKITYSVPYMGNYELDGVEGSGSHPAVDIKLPIGTPVYAIANGVAVKVSKQNTGFGNHIVLIHKDFPSPDNPSAKETLYSSYSHMDEVLIAEGSIVRRGQQIGTVGETGTATTPHLHFQIDNEDAPWHPYWPFTFQEAAAEGYSFTEAVNEGLGAEKALKATVNPMMYVQTYLTATSSSVDMPSEILADSSADGDTVEVDAVSADEAGSEASGSAVSAEESNLEDEAGTELGSDSGASTGDESSPSLDTSDSDVPDESNVLLPETVSVVADADVETTGNVAIFSDVSPGDVSYDAIYFLKKYGVISGYPDGSFGPENEVSRAEVLKIILNAINANLFTGDLPFSDIPDGEWFTTYVATAYDRQIIDGYPDLTFRPANVVNRAELLKILLEAFAVNVNDEVIEDVYADVSKDEWYAPYVAYGKEKNLIVLKDGLFRPEEGMTRREVAETVYRILMLKLGGARKYSSGIEVSETDLVEYFG